MSVRSPFSRVFPKPHIVDPTSDHRYTVLALHGLNSTSEIFASRLGLSPKLTSRSKPTPAHGRLCSEIGNFPTQHIRFVSPTAPVRTIDAPPFTLATHVWFYVGSFTDLEVRQEEQIPGLTESVTYILDIVEKETASPTTPHNVMPAVAASSEETIQLPSHRWIGHFDRTLALSCCTYDKGFPSAKRRTFAGALFHRFPVALRLGYS